jgi:hypothetical protein
MKMLIYLGVFQIINDARFRTGKLFMTKVAGAQKRLPTMCDKPHPNWSIRLRDIVDIISA